jgi:hypothetical protein
MVNTSLEASSCSIQVVPSSCCAQSPPCSPQPGRSGCALLPLGQGKHTQQCRQQLPQLPMHHPWFTSSTWPPCPFSVLQQHACQQTSLKQGQHTAFLGAYILRSTAVATNGIYMADNHHANAYCTFTSDPSRLPSTSRANTFELQELPHSMQFPQCMHRMHMPAWLHVHAACVCCSCKTLVSNAAIAIPAMKACEPVLSEAIDGM